MKWTQVTQLTKNKHIIRHIENLEKITTDTTFFTFGCLYF